MDQLAGILLHMDLMDTDGLFAALRCLDLDTAVMADRQVQLGNLVVLRIVRVEVVLTVKFAVLVDLAVGGKTYSQCQLYDTLI